MGPGTGDEYGIDSRYLGQEQHPGAKFWVLDLDERYRRRESWMLSGVALGGAPLAGVAFGTID